MINFYQNSCNKETEDGWVAVAVEQQRNHGDPYSTEIHKSKFSLSGICGKKMRYFFRII